MAEAQTDRLVIGAGAVGLAVARAFALAGDDVILIDQNPAFGMETSSRNSEVIHAGIYYPEGSLKARLCVEGMVAMYAFCEKRSVATRCHGKLIVATDDEQVAALEELKRVGDGNGAPGLELIGRERTRQLEPEICALGAIYSPMTGTVDSHGYMAALEADAENNGAIIAYCSRFVRAEKTAGGFHVVVDGQGEEIVIFCRHLVNCGGHGARNISLAIDAVDEDSVPPHYMAKGQYFNTTRKPPFRHLIYPMPSGSGLGIHLTLDSGNGARFGPDAAWVDVPSYDVDAADAEKFHRSISTYWPELKQSDLVPAWAGLRPKVAPDDKRFHDFLIHDESRHGCEGLIALYGIDSPGLTSSLAIASHIAAMG